MKFLRYYYPSSALYGQNGHRKFRRGQFRCGTSHRTTVSPRDSFAVQEVLPHDSLPAGNSPWLVCRVFFPEEKFPAAKLSRSETVVRRDLPSWNCARGNFLEPIRIFKEEY